MGFKMKSILTGLAVALLCTAGARAQPAYEQYDSPIPDEPTFMRSHGSGQNFDGLRPGLGREETYYLFSGCLKIGWIKQQRLRRTEWEMAVDKMAMDCKLDPLEGDERDIVVNYLVRNYGRGS